MQPEGRRGVRGQRRIITGKLSHRASISGKEPSPGVGSLKRWEKLDGAGIHLEGRTEGLAWPAGTGQDREQEGPVVLSSEGSGPVAGQKVRPWSSPPPLSLMLQVFLAQ